MSKLEEKFKYECNYGICEDTGIKGIDADMAKDCAKITEQECIGFAEWLDEWFSIIDDNTQKDTAALFQLYQKSKENE